MNNYEEWNRQLAEHTIQSVEFYRFRGRYPRLHGKNARLSYHGFGGEVVVAKLKTDSGYEGWAQLSAELAEAREAAKLLEKRRVTELFSCESGILSETLHAFDLPLHDLAGNILGIPVCRMINPEAKLTANVYDGAIYMNDIIPEDHPFGVQKVIEECLDDWAMGQRILKVKIGRGNKWMAHDEGLARDIEIVRAIHEALPAAQLMVDANDGYTVQDAIAFLEGIKHTPIYWFEEPFREEESRNRALKQYLKTNRPMTLIADGESMTDIDLLFSLADKGLMDVWQPDVCSYGFTKWRQLMRTLSAKGYLASPHAWGNAVKTYYCAHLAAAYPHHIPCVEAVLGTSEGVDYSGYALNDGVVTIPNKPGFGMDFIWMPEA